MWDRYFGIYPLFFDFASSNKATGFPLRISRNRKHIENTEKEQYNQNRKNGIPSYHKGSYLT